jgi:hypothetical protein
MLFLVFLIAGIAAILWVSSWLETKMFQRGMAKHGGKYQPTVDAMKVGYFVAFAFFAGSCLYVSGGKREGSGNDNPCGVTLRC